MLTCRTTTRPPPSGELRKVFRSRPRAALCSGRSRRLSLCAACTLQETWFCIKTAAGPAADGCQTTRWTVMSIPEASSNGSRGIASGALGQAQTGTWSSWAWFIRQRVCGRHRPTLRSPVTPIIREKPFLQVDKAGDFSVRIPSLRANSVGITWQGGETPGRSIPITSSISRGPASTPPPASMLSSTGVRTCF